MGLQGGPEGASWHAGSAARTGRPWGCYGQAVWHHDHVTLGHPEAMTSGAHGHRWQLDWQFLPGPTLSPTFLGFQQNLSTWPRPCPHPQPGSWGFLITDWSRHSSQGQGPGSAPPQSSVFKLKGPAPCLGGPATEGPDSSPAGLLCLSLLPCVPRATNPVTQNVGLKML